MKNYPVHDYTERDLVGEKLMVLDMNKTEDMDLIYKIGKALSNGPCGRRCYSGIEICLGVYVCPSCTAV